MFNNLFGSNKKELSMSILLVSDDETTLALIYTALGQKGCSVYSASTPENAIQMLDTIELPDIIIGDFYNPEHDGKTFIERAQARFGTSALSPIIFLMDSTDDEAVAHKMGVVDLIQKPVDIEHLMNSITKIVESQLASQDLP